MIMFVIFSLVLAISLPLYAHAQEKIPLYLSIAAHNETANDKVMRFIELSLFELLERNPDKMSEEQRKISIDLADFVFNSYTIFERPDSWHATCLYIGNNSSQTETDIYKNFVEGVEVDLVTSTFLYIPGKLMAAPLFFKDFKLIENKFPHMTLMIGFKNVYRAVDSNYLLRAMFEDNEELKEKYHSGEIENENVSLYRHLKNVKITFDDTKKELIEENVYVLKSKEVLTLQAYTLKNYAS